MSLNISELTEAITIGLGIFMHFEMNPKKAPVH